MSGENDSQVLVQLAEVKGQLSAVLQLMQQQHESTHQRINDFRHAVEGRLSNVETRVTTLEKNERSTALKSAGSSAVVLGAVELVKFIAGR